MKKTFKIIISGGGTGGHIFPAVSIANALKAKLPNAEFLFVGAEGRMEMERVPQAGYKIIGLPMMGFDRKNLLKNVKVLFNLAKSLLKARRIIRDFQPDVAIGVGGYASGALLKAANWAGVPTVLQEQNSFAGVTNKLLAKKAALICVAYEGMERFFPENKIILTGNPVRQNLFETRTKNIETRRAAYEFFGFSPGKKTLLVVGGSLGAKTINQSILAGIEKLSDIQVIWQTGKIYFENIQQELVGKNLPNLYVSEFLSQMDYAYSVADLVISRAGASSISELCLLGKPSILVPSPNVSEDHQTHNAMALVNKKAAVLVKDSDAQKKLVDTALALLNDSEKLEKLEQNSLALGLPNAANHIADEIIRLIER
ncbi:MAG: undecaprenyldiphospho-muramoylpentapeptide beta-N-acetylglucosaminyltransferase [Prevotellaceae bacterium]|jgi:UDP-N-acetylglucosamine--N-acetylmuramyl-(pentapeptide) pyrophosphoryl-undecaprenol N-acetylglucosamine transferase|nr:undecaprenyldiphospho-muramoylpentapeptide beta-N-acetylglucosaminyltransferase [Prevotellaceae bacterium]